MNIAEQGIKDSKRKVIRKKQKKRDTRIVWYFGTVHKAKLMFMTVLPNKQLKGRTPYEVCSVSP